MAGIEEFLKTYNQYHSTFKETSLDDKKNIYLCNDTTQNVLNFDIMIKDKYRGKRERPKSFDAIYQLDTTLYLVEFKNQIPSQINNQDIQQKLLDGKAELDTFLAACNIQKDDYFFKYCVVYKNFKKPYDRYKKGVSKNIIEFGLENVNSLVNAIKTDSVSEFTLILNKKLPPSALNCEHV